MCRLDEIKRFISNTCMKKPSEDLGVFLSIGNRYNKAKVIFFNNHEDFNNNFLDRLKEFKKEFAVYPEWVKIDFITKKLSIEFQDLRKNLIETRRNYINYGFSLDEEFELAFLPEEINANAFVRPKKREKTTFYLSRNNINGYLEKYRVTKKRYDRKDFNDKIVIQFFTKGFILDNNREYELKSNGYEKGLRVVEDLHDEIDRMIYSATHFLKNEIQPSGKYIYGYFPHFDKKINFYNNLRHSSSTYSLIEGLSYINETLESVKKPIDYIIKNYLYVKDGKGYIFDDTKNINEIKLGQNAAFIFAVSEYLKHEENKEYLEAAQLVAEGTIDMIDDNGETVHILDYPTLEVKEKYRIVYYDGEAALGLLRLYQHDGNEKWLNAVKSLFEKFIKRDYWRYNDHWLGYCANEMVNIIPDRRYFELGIKNVSTNLTYIYKRETTFPTFMEMLTASYKLVQKAKEKGYEDLVESLIDEDFLIKTLHKRADYQRTGYFYPEIAMYFKNPSRILGAFFIKHHGYRVRIDDIEHYVSGYIQYQKLFKSSIE